MKEDKPKVRKLRPLANRQTRIRLLAASYQDAAIDSVTSETKGRGGKHWIFPKRNSSLWQRGSYKELEQAMDHLRSERHDYYRDFHKVFVHDPYNKIKTEYPKQVASSAIKGFQIIDKMMPRDVFVPTDVSESAGYLLGDAKQYQKARKK
jgi:hypothetical protein